MFSLTALTILAVIINLVCPILPQDTDNNNVNEACNHCKCNEKQSIPPATHFEFDCFGQELSQTFSIIPQFFGDNNQTGKFLNIIYNNNTIINLHQLAPTNATISFSCQLCHIKSIEIDAFLQTPNIFRLDLSKNELNGLNISENIFRGNSPCSMISTDDDNSQCLHLTELDLSHNKIGSLHSNIFMYLRSSLKRLRLNDNPIITFYIETAKAIGACSSTLELLDLSNTDIDNLPKELFNKDNSILRELYLQGNRFLTVPESLSILSGSLVALDFSDNLCEEITNESFLLLTKLKELQLNEMNELSDINLSAFQDLHALEKLSLRDNKQLTKLNLFSLISASNLVMLDLRNCSLTTLEINIVSSKANETTTIESSSSTQNNETLPAKIIFEQLRLLLLMDNPWHCDCTLYKTLEHLMHYEPVIFESEFQSRCATPYDLATDLLVDLLVDPDKCELTNNRKPPRKLPYDPPAFLRPRSLLLTLLSILSVIFIGLVIGLVIVWIKRKLTDNDLLMNSEIRYTTVRNSTISTTSTTA